MSSISLPTNFVPEVVLESYIYGSLSDQSEVKNVIRGNQFSNDISFTIGPLWATITAVRFFAVNQANDKVNISGNFNNLKIELTVSGKHWSGWDDTFYYKDNGIDKTAPDIDLLPSKKIYYDLDQKSTFQIQKKKVYKIEIDINPTAYDNNKTTFDSNTTTIRNEKDWKQSIPFKVVTAEVYIDQVVDNNFLDVTDFIAKYY